MYLKSLDVYGFKSFPDKTSLTFEPGITVVVGPNGCGKSNVFDAIKWALGEQRPKSLRGSKMEDIIFNGTANHPALNYCEVTLTFSNEDNYLPIDYKEVAVSRKLYRSGESEYYMNKNQVRLKDIQTLFMGTGVGESTYSFVEQGKIEVFLSYKPEEKRLIFDEASGIVKYKERKRETLRRLEETEQNLTRLEDIITEVQRQIRYLERQVAKAKKYKEVEEALVRIEEKVAFLQISRLEKSMDLLLEELNSFKQQESGQEEGMTSLREKIDNSNQKLREMRTSLEEVSSRIIALHSHIELYDNTIGINNQRMEESTARIENIGEEQKELETKIEFQAKRLHEEKEMIVTLENDLQRLTGEISSLRREQEEITAQIKDIRGQIGEKKEGILTGEMTRATLNNDLVEIQAQVRNMQGRRKRLLLDNEKLNAFFLERQQLFQSVQQETESLEQEFSRVKQERDLINEEIRVHARARETLHKEREEKEKQLIELRSHYELLKDLRVKYGGISSTQKIKLIFDAFPSQVNKLIVSLKDAKVTTDQQDGRTLYVAEVEAKAVLFEESELEDKMTLLSQDIAEKTRQAVAAEEKETSFKTKAEQLQDTLSELDKKLGRKVQEKENLEQEFSRVKEELELLQTEIAENDSQLKEAEGKKQTMENDFSQADSRLISLKAALEQAQNTLASISDRFQAAEVDSTKKETEAAALKDQKDALLRRILISEEDRNSFYRNKERLGKEREEHSQKIIELTGENDSLKEKIEAEKKEIASLSEEKDKLRQAEQVVFEEREQLLGNLQGDEKKIEEIRGLIYEKKLKMQEVEYEKSKIKDYLQQVYHIDYKGEESGVEEPLEELTESRDKLKKRLVSLGEVNLVAIEEFEELNKRFTFLTEQRNDLVTSKEELKKAIQKINRTSRQIFMDVFTRISEEFKKNFRYLFNGGRAELVLLDEDNILESGVEIEVQPPGKKLQNVSLLSGGEKALTATALIFSIFQVRPSPLCVLDEIDAPLDEANVDRFNQILRDFAHHSQFVVITHNKKTMGMADVLYGVTMQEKGVSKIVSVKFAEEEATLK